MSRSIKKGPFVAPELFKRVEELNKNSRPGPAHLPFSPPSSVTRLLCMTAAVMCRSTSPRTWSATSWANSFPPERSVVTPAARPPILNEGGRQNNGSKSLSEISADLSA